MVKVVWCKYFNTLLICCSSFLINFGINSLNEGLSVILLKSIFFNSALKSASIFTLFIVITFSKLNFSFSYMIFRETLYTVSSIGSLKESSKVGCLVLKKLKIY